MAARAGKTKASSRTRPVSAGKGPTPAELKAEQDAKREAARERTAKNGPSGSKNIPRGAVDDLGGGGNVKGDARERRKKRIARRQRREEMLWVEALDMASTYEIPITRGNNIVDVLQTLLDRLMDQWKLVCKIVDGLPRKEWLFEAVDEQGNRVYTPNVWMQYEQSLRQELMDLSLRMGHLGVDERRVRVQEAQMELLGRALQAAAHNAGLSAGDQRKLGAALRVELAKLESGYDDQPEFVQGKKRARKNDKHPEITAGPGGPPDIVVEEAA